MNEEQIEEAERLLGYYEIHGATEWGVTDMVALLRDLLPDHSAFKEAS